MSWVIAIFGLALLIVLHEGGHFLVARLCGMRVERFSIGFGPTLLGFKRGGTTFQIAPIPLGGFVQITGLNPNELTVLRENGTLKTMRLRREIRYFRESVRALVGLEESNHANR